MREEEHSRRVPEGYRLEGSGRTDRLTLVRPDGSAVCAFAFSAFSPSPEAILRAVEEDLARGRAEGEEAPEDAS